jgi:hypothetical protein
MQEVVHTGNVATVSSTVVTGSGSSFTASMTGMVIGFGSTDPNKVTTWYTLGAWTSSTVIAITSGPTISVTTPFVIVFNFPMMYPHVLTYNSTIDMAREWLETFFSGNEQAVNEYLKNYGITSGQ